MKWNQFAFNCFPLEKHCIFTVCVLNQCRVITSIRGSYKMNVVLRIIVVKDELCKALLRANYIIMGYNLCSICVCSTAKIKFLSL
jgi:hypothetical protein